MRLDDLLQVMRDEFAQAASDIDDQVMAWLGAGPAGAEVHAPAMAADLDRLVMTSRLIALEGLAVALEQLRDGALALALLDEDTMGQGLGWLSGWRAPFEAAFAAPGAAEPADELLAYLGQGPMAPPIGTLAELRPLLVTAPRLPVDAVMAEPLPAATEADVSLALPEDTDHDLYETFLADAPAQLARLSDAVRQLVRGGLDESRLVEAQRVAHTFKGSGSIIGIVGVARLAHRIEDLIEFAGRQGGQLPRAMGHDLEQATATLDQMVYALRGEEDVPTQARAHLQRLLGWVQAIQDGSWAEGLSELDTTAAQAPAPVPASAAEAPSQAAPPSPAAEPTDSGEAQLRVGVSRLDRLLRRAGQGLVQGGLIGEQLRRLDERLAAMDTLNTALHGRLAELQRALERQGVTLQEKSQAEGEAFDPLEMDRYNHVQTLSRFVAELVSDEAELARGAREDTQRAALTLREHATALKEQHRELLGARLVPFRQIVSRLRRTVQQTGATLQRPVRLEVEGEETQLDSDVLERLTEPLLHLLRNAVDHGIESAEERVLFGKPEEGLVRLSVRRDGQTVHVQCVDDGRGIDLAAVHAKAVDLGLLAADQEPMAQAVARLILLPGFSTRAQVTEVSGRGVGMDVVAERVRAMKGHVDISSEPLAGTTITLRLPATTGSVHALVVDAGGERFALPTEAVIQALAAGQGRFVDGRYHLGGQHYRAATLAHWLGLPDTIDDGCDGDDRPVVLVSGEGSPVALRVDRVVDARELILQDVGELLRGARGVAGGALRSDGRVLFVLDVERLDAGSALALPQAAAAALRQRAQARRQRVLVVDDAISVRKAVSQLLEDAGYEVLTARDGFDALQQLQATPVDAVITDLEMPQLNGLELTRQLRQAPALQALPVVMITSRTTDKHRQAAQEAGVSHYLTKPYTDGELLALLRQLLAG
jgi:chemotaxis protein histidine kinase CheA